MRTVLGFMFALTALAGEGPGACMECHDIPSEKYAKSAHAGQDCLGCHPGAARHPHKGRPASVDCSACHEEVVKAFRASTHAGSACSVCHGPAHSMLGASDPASMVAKKSLPSTCGACHSNPEFLATHQLGFAHPVEAYQMSTHGREVAKGRTEAAGCSDCHTSHAILKASDPASSIHRQRLSTTCGRCHSEVQAAFEGSIHGKAVKHGLKGAPTCADCHGEHSILAPSEPGSLVNPARVSAATCGRCHADERLVERYALPKEKVQAFQDSFHGLSSKGGSTRVANCASCHGVHNILPSSDPKSLVHAANLGATCGKCHPGTSQHIIAGPVHVVSNTSSEHPVVRFIRRAYAWFLIPLTLGFMGFHNAVDFIAKLRRRLPTDGTGEKLPRMNLGFRIAHGLVALSFILLVLTGFALKYPESFWAKPWLLFETRIPFRGWVHRISAMMMVAGTLFHGLHLLLIRRDRVILRELIPGLRDLKDILQALRHNLGFKADRPAFGMFSYAEKLEYWAYLWGAAIMGVTGWMLWAENWSLRHFPKWVMDAAATLHWYEAILATFSILIWHGYAVIFDPEVYPMDTAWADGMTSGDHMKRTRPAYYARLKGKTGPEE